MDKTILKFQKNEITQHHVYRNMAKSAKGKNKKALEGIAADELKHYHHFKKITGRDAGPDWFMVFRYTIMAAVFGITFASKLMEKGESDAQIEYSTAAKKYKGIKVIIKDEEKHERQMLGMIEEEKLGYISSMMLGLNDAIVELTGALAGFTFALQNTKVIGLAGLITGVTAALSMAAAEYLSQRSEKTVKSPLKAALYTGAVYMFVVAVLVAPYFILANYYAALGLIIGCVILVILGSSFFVSVVQDKSFKKIFWEMAAVCLSVSFIAFLIGFGARKLLNIEI